MLAATALAGRTRRSMLSGACASAVCRNVCVARGQWFTVFWFPSFGINITLRLWIAYQEHLCWFNWICGRVFRFQLQMCVTNCLLKCLAWDENDTIRSLHVVGNYSSVHFKDHTSGVLVIFVSEFRTVPFCGHLCSSVYSFLWFDICML
jgi:hypothetical protein